MATTGDTIKLRGPAHFFSFPLYDCTTADNFLVEGKLCFNYLFSKLCNVINTEAQIM